MENAEDDLVQKTEVAITLMKTVLENVSWTVLLVRRGRVLTSRSLNLSRTSMSWPKPR